MYVCIFRILKVTVIQNTEIFIAYFFMFYRFQPPRIPAYMEAISLMAPLGCMRWVVSSFFFEARPASDALLRREETKRNRCWSNLDDL